MKLAEKGAPLLLIHGDNDNNSGTHPMQSERMYQAVSGQVCLSHTHTRAPFGRSPAHARARAHTHSHARAPSLSGQGGVVKLCILPHEAHGYKARESIMHTLAEQVCCSTYS